MRQISIWNWSAISGGLSVPTVHCPVRHLGLAARTGCKLKASADHVLCIFRLSQHMLAQREVHQQLCRGTFSANIPFTSTTIDAH